MKHSPQMVLVFFFFWERNHRDLAITVEEIATFR